MTSLVPTIHRRGGLSGFEPIPPPIKTGSIVDGVYVIKSKLGTGGMATVFEAWQADLDRFVAVKVMTLIEQDLDDLKRRFFNELLLATRVKHPNIVEVFDFGMLTKSGHPYIVMDKLHGDTLQKVLRLNGPLSPARAVSLFKEVLSALAAAHEQNVIHKDIKPTNLFLANHPSSITPSERLVILDFGIAQRVTPSLDATDDIFTGTPRYTAPEYYDKQQISPQLDIYQVGLVLVEAITGQPAVLAKNLAACIKAHLTGQLHIPPWLAQSSLGAVVRKALAPNPKDRFYSAYDFRNALDALKDSELPTPVNEHVPTESEAPATLISLSPPDFDPTHATDKAQTSPGAASIRVPVTSTMVLKSEYTETSPSAYETDPTLLSCRPEHRQDNPVCEITAPRTFFDLESNDRRLSWVLMTLVSILIAGSWTLYALLHTAH